MFTQSVHVKYQLSILAGTEGLETAVDSAKRMLAKFFHNQKIGNNPLPFPVIKIVDDRGPHWLGKCRYAPNELPGNCTILIQKKILGDSETLDRVMAHELIHHLEYMLTSQTQNVRTMRWTTRGHGQFFHEWERRINSQVGKDWINESSDSSYVLTDESRPALIVIRKMYNDRLVWSWMVRPSAGQKEELKRLEHEAGAKVFRSTNSVLMTGPKFAKWGKWASGDKEIEKLLKEMYEHDTQVAV